MLRADKIVLCFRQEPISHVWLYDGMSINGRWSIAYPPLVDASPHLLQLASEGPTCPDTQSACHFRGTVPIIYGAPIQLYLGVNYSILLVLLKNFEHDEPYCSCWMCATTRESHPKPSCSTIYFSEDWSLALWSSAHG